MAKWILHWKDEHSEIIEGDTVAQAARNAGIGNGAVPSMDYFEPYDVTGKHVIVTAEGRYNGLGAMVLEQFDPGVNDEEATVIVKYVNSEVVAMLKRDQVRAL